MNCSDNNSDTNAVLVADKHLVPTIMDVQSRTVKARYPFKPTNNDELCFQKGDVITVTQQLEGGWWEGTLHGKTGWFPSNYVVECKPG